MQEDLAQRIENVFTQAPYPGDNHIGVREVEDFIGQKEWQKVPLEVLARKQTGLLSFYPEAYRFYLPAYLCAVLRHLELEYLEDPITYSLIRYIDRTSDIPQFNEAEKLLIVEFLEGYRELFPLSSYVILDDKVTELQRAIQFWKESLV